MKELVHETIALFRPEPNPINGSFDFGAPGKLRQPRRSKRKWITWIALIGWMFVVVGIIGEGIFEAYVSGADGLLQDFNNIVLADAQRQVARANERAAEAEKEAAQLESQIADRHITVEQRKKMLDVLKFRPGTNVRVDWLLSSPEPDSLGYAREIADVFHDANWNVNPYTMSLTSFERPVFGILVETKTSSAPDIELRALVRKAFIAAGIPASSGDADPHIVSPSVVEVFVGGKPPQVRQ